MRLRRMVGWIMTVGAAWLVPTLIGPGSGGSMESVVMAQQAPSSDVTFTKDIAPILQRTCQNCHRPDGVAPMSLITYEEVRPWARAIKTRTGIGPARRRDAALVHREEHRHPALQERSVAQRRGDREDRAVGGQRRAAGAIPRTCRRAKVWDDVNDLAHR